MTTDHLLAKSWDREASAAPPVAARLVPHLRAVQAAGETIVRIRGMTILENLDLEPAIWLPRLHIAIALACLLHDVGKATSWFQAMVRGEAGFDSKAQPIRHELVSVLFLLRNTGGLADWLRAEIRQAGFDDETEYLFQTVVGAIAGHHSKMVDDWRAAFPAGDQAHGGGGTEIELYLSQPDLRRLFGGLPHAKKESWSLLRRQPSYPGKTHASFNSASQQWKERLDASPEWKRFAAAIKALTVAADVAGSALLPEAVSMKQWITDTLGRYATKSQLFAVATLRLRGRSTRRFQDAIAASQARVTLAEAGCASGKTAAAWLWAAEKARGRKVFFCYPTTGTATQGFLDYIPDSDLEGELVHSRAAVDLDRVAMSGDASRAEEHQDQLLRIDSLKLWAPAAVICTIDTVLAMVRNNRRGLYGSPAILSGAFVFDELHAYDDTLFAAVLALIRALPGAPFLLMSASLPKQRKVLLERTLGHIGSVEPPAELESIKRYRLKRSEFHDALAQAAGVVRDGGRVLWVCNVVPRAQALFDQAREADLPAVCYHSRFRYDDRVKRHQDVVNAFEAPAGKGLLAITTQVAEMSLDLDADLLVTELAPIPSLIQRLGRLNRRVSEQNPGQARDAIFIEAQTDAPYGQVDLALARQWLDALTGNAAVSQRDLADHFEVISGATAESPAIPTNGLDTQWLDSGWCAEPGQTRDRDFNVSVLLARDVDACRACRQEITKRSLPMRYHACMAEWKSLHGILLAPPDTIHYDEHRGAMWAD
jgi:CRISPR-associated endonuclease/helicase Cas3